jgi:MinD superfamily P-loop ATPase
MKQLAIISGKGGTGKTVIASSLAVLAPDKILVDADVDAPNLHLMLSPRLISQQDFWGAKIAVIDEDACLKCGLCAGFCRFCAIDDQIKVNPYRCEGCGVCVQVCPAGAAALKDELTGYLYLSQTPYGLLSHARLKTGVAEASGKLITAIRRVAEEIAQKQGIGQIIIDGSPGIGCPVIASLTGVSLALIVTEPTLSGLSDLKRIEEVTEHFKIKTAVCINKYDLNEENTSEIARFCRERNLALLAKIPFDEEVIKSVQEGQPLINYTKSRTTQALEELWRKIKDEL